MADDSSKLREQIAYLTDLIKSHKKIPSPASISGVHPHTVNNKNRSFSWQKETQKRKATKQQILHPPLNQVKGQTGTVHSSYSLDRRKLNSKSSGHDTAKTKINIPFTSGSSGYSQTMNDNKSILESKTALKQNDRKAEIPVPKMEQAQKSHLLSLQPSHTLTAKNPYVLNKKEIPHLSGVKTVVQKSALKWKKPSATCTSGLSSDKSKSHSDSELHKKKSQLLRAEISLGMPSTKVKSPSVVPPKAPSTSGAHGSFKWSKSKPSTSSKLEKSGKKSKPSRSKLKWTKLGAQCEAKKQLNPYVLRRESSGGSSPEQRQRLISNKAEKLKKQPHYSTKYQADFVTSNKVLSRKSAAGFIDRRQRTTQGESPVVTRYSVVRSKRKQAPIKAQKLNKVVVIGGVPYKTSSNKLTKAKTSSAEKEIGKGGKKVGKLTKTIIIQGEKFVSDSKGKTLQRINKAPRRASLKESGSSKLCQTLMSRRRSSNGRIVVLRTPTTLIRSKLNNTPSKALASRVLRRSIHNARVSSKNRSKPVSEQYCMFYNRFGKCHKRDTCPYIHDPSKVAVCTKFLRGRCKNLDGSCPFSHKIDPTKMPVCQFFLRGKCSNDNCPYSHVNVSKKAKVCEDFLKGFCARGQQCDKKHILECEEFSRTGKCSKGSNCKLMHKARKPAAARKRKSSSNEGHGTSKLPKQDFTSDEGFLPLIAGASDPEQISAQDSLGNSQGEAKEMTAEPVVIRPRFLKPRDAEKVQTPERTSPE